VGLEDAKAFSKDMYALIVDFTSAFNTTDHDRMLWIMYDLGFPTDAIDTVKNLMKTLPLKSGYPREEAPDKYLLRGGKSKVIHYLPLYFCSTWNHSFDGSTYWAVGTSTAAFQTKMLLTPTLLIS